MTIHFGDVPENSTLYVPFSTYNSSGASVTITGLAATDIEIYRNGSTTQRASDAGYTLLDTDGIDFDGLTGIHGFSIDLSNNGDAGFYVVGSQYWVVVSTITADSQTISFVACTFRIRAAEATAGYPVITHKVGTGTGEINLSSGGVPLTSAANTAIVTELMGTTTENNGSLTFKTIMRVLTAILAGRVSISGSTVTFRTADNAKVRATVVTDSSNQRTTVTLDGTD
jgi:hypothetical protein